MTPRSTFPLLMILAAPLGSQAPAPRQVQGQLRFGGAMVTFVNPDARVWKEEAREVREERGFVLISHRDLLGGPAGRKVRPVLSLLFQRLYEAPSTARSYFDSWQDRLPFKVERILEDKPGKMVVEGGYTRDGASHQVVAAFLVSGKVGLQAMCDATGDLFPKVEEDGRAWIAKVQLGAPPPAAANP